MHNRVIFVLGIYAVGLMPTLIGQESQEESMQQIRGIWVWKTQAETIINDKAERTEFFDFCHKPHGYPERSITHLYIHIDQTRLQSSDQDLTGFLQEAHHAGFKVEYLCGTPEWATESKRGKGKERVRLFLEFNQNLPPSQRFDGLHFDIDPSALDGWEINTEVYWDQYVGLLKNCRQQIIAYNSNVSPNISFACDIPRWYDMDESPSGAITSHQDVQDIADYIVVMDYRDKAFEIIEDAREEIQYGQDIGKSVVIGVLTGVPKGGVPHNTFLEEGYHFMEEQLAFVADSYAQISSFKGFAFHDYESYSELLLPDGIPKSGPIPGINEKSAYLTYYGAWNQERVHHAKQFDLVILHPNTNITAEWITEIKNGLDGISSTPDDVIILGYISLGEDETKSPRTGDGLGPGGYASWYLDKTPPIGMPDKNGQWNSYYVDAANPKWQKFLKAPPASSDSPVGSDDIVRRLGCDGLFLDTIDTASPWGRYSCSAAGMSFFIKTIRIWYPDKILVANRGLFYYSPDKKDGIDYMTWSPRDYINGVVFESYYTEWDWDKNEGLVSPLFPDINKTDLAKKLNDSAYGSYGFTVLCLDYLSKQQPDYQRMLNVQVQETIVQQKWANYIGNILLDTIRTDVLDYLDSLQQLDSK